MKLKTGLMGTIAALALGLGMAQAEGVKVGMITSVPPSAQADALRAKGVEILAGHAVYEAHADGKGELAGITACRIDGSGRVVSGSQRRIACDGLAMSTGWAPAANLLYQAGTRMRFDDGLQQFVPNVLPQGVFACGRVNGAYRIESRIADGRRAGADHRDADQLIRAPAVIAAMRTFKDQHRRAGAL